MFLVWRAEVHGSVAVAQRELAGVRRLRLSRLTGVPRRRTVTVTATEGANIATTTVNLTVQ